MKERYGAVVAVEDLPRGCLGNSSADFDWLVANVPDFKICYDTNHLLGEESHAFAARFAPYIVSIHVSDYDGVDERHWMPGRGIVEWPKVIDVLIRSGYDGPFMYEVTPRQRSAPGASNICARRQIAFLPGMRYIKVSNKHHKNPEK